MHQRHRELSAHSTGADGPAQPQINPAAALVQTPALLGIRVRAYLAFWLLVAVAGTAIFWLRGFALGRSYDIFIDEFTYLQLSRGFADHMTISLYGKPFYLHPPAFFLLAGSYINLVQPSRDFIAQIYAVRYLNVFLASCTGVMVLLIGRRAAGLHAGLIAAGLFALDPFIIKMNSLVLLDTATLWWIMAGFALLCYGLREEQATPNLAQVIGARSRMLAQRWAWMRPPAEHVDAVALVWWRSVGVGVLFGVAILTKDMAVFLTLLPLGICFIGNWVIQRRSLLVIGTVTCCVYALYPLVVIGIGDGDILAQQKLRGVLRLVGVVKETGVNRHGGPSLANVIVARLQQFGTTYALISLGVVAMGVLLMRGGAISRMVALVTASSFVMIAYCIGIGTLEEQFFYFLVLPCALAVGVAVPPLLLTALPFRHLQGALRAAAGLFAVVFVSWSCYQWIYVHLTPDNVHEQMETYVQQNLPSSSKITATGQPAQFMMEEHSTGPWGMWKSVSDLQVYHPDYVVINPYQLRWNFGTDATPLTEWLDQHGTLIVTWHGRASNTDMMLYRVSPAQWKGAPQVQQ